MNSFLQRTDGRASEVAQEVLEDLKELSTDVLYPYYPHTGIAEPARSYYLVNVVSLSFCLCYSWPCFCSFTTWSISFGTVYSSIPRNKYQHVCFLCLDYFFLNYFVLLFYSTSSIAR